MRRLLFLALLAAGCGASDIGERVTCLSGVALNASAATRTCTIENPSGAYSFATVEAARTRVAGTDFSMTCVSTNGTGTPAALRGGCERDASGTCEFAPDTEIDTTSSTLTYGWEVRLRGWTRMACTFASTSAGGTDLLTMNYRLVTQ